MEKYNVGDLVRVQFYDFHVYCRIGLSHEGKKKCQMVNRPGTWFDPTFSFMGQRAEEIQRVDRIPSQDEEDRFAP